MLDQDGYPCEVYVSKCEADGSNYSLKPDSLGNTTISKGYSISLTSLWITLGYALPIQQAHNAVYLSRMILREEILDQIKKF